MNISDTNYFKKIKNGEKFVIGDPIKSKATGRFVIPPCQISRDNGQPNGTENCNQQLEIKKLT
jgi:hypothetical protein